MYKFWISQCKTWCSTKTPVFSSQHITVIWQTKAHNTIRNFMYNKQMGEFHIMNVYSTTRSWKHTQWGTQASSELSVIKTDTPAKHRGTNYGTGTKMGGEIMLKFRSKPSNSCSRSSNKWKTDKLSRHPHTLSAQNQLFIYSWTAYGKKKFPVIYCMLILWFTAFISLVL